MLVSLRAESKEKDGKDNLTDKKARKPSAKKVDSVNEDALEMPEVRGTTKVGPIVKEKAVRKSRAKKKVDSEAVEAVEVKKNAVRKPRAKKDAVDSPDGREPKQKAVRKPRAKKIAEVPQAKLNIAQVGKAGIKKDKQDKQAAVVSKYFPTNETLGLSGEDFCLEEAVPRRSAWTPPPNFSEAVETTPSAIESIDLSGNSTDSIECTKKFPDLLGSFGYCNNSIQTVEKRFLDDLGPRKRKLIEVVRTNISTKTIKKKARTLTNLATSAYSEETPAEPAPLLQYFSRKTTDRGIEDDFKLPGKPHLLTKKPKRGTAEAPILLSPESALKQVTNQDFVFGTSSQLARERSPTLLRDLHAAMQASNEPDDDAFTGLMSVPINSFDVPNANLSTKRNLWSAASRDEIDHKEERPQVAAMDPNVASPKPVNVLESPAKKPSKSAKKPEIQMPNFEAYTNAQLMKQVASYRFKPVKKREQMILLLEKCWESKQRLALSALGTNGIIGSSPKKFAGSAEEKPSSNQATTISPKRPRGRPRKDSTPVSPAKIKPATVKCDEKDTIGILDFDDDIPLSQIRTPKISQRKPKHSIEEISDPDTDLTPSRRFKTPVQSPIISLPLQLSSPPLAESSQLLFDSITKAVVDQHIAKDSKYPNWHEKILLYDPIVLEDFTVWLNTGGLEKAGWDGEVEPKEVKKWCESKSICCLWRESLRNGTRNRY